MKNHCVFPSVTRTFLGWIILIYKLQILCIYSFPCRFLTSALNTFFRRVLLIPKINIHLPRNLHKVTSSLRSTFKNRVQLAKIIDPILLRGTKKIYMKKLQKCVEI